MFYVNTTSIQLTLTVDRVTRFQAQLSERIRRWRRTRLTLRSPGGSHRTTAVSFRHGFVGHGTSDVSATRVTDTPVVQQMSVAKSDSRILYMESKVINRSNTHCNRIMGKGQCYYYY